MQTNKISLATNFMEYLKFSYDINMLFI